jgi:hypothetical protein
MKQTLTEIFNEYGSDKGSYFTHVGSTINVAHNYTQIYDELMSPYRDKEINFLEIGIWSPYYPGASIKSWTRYFSNINFYGLDIEDCRHLSNDKIKIFVGDQSNEEFLKNVVDVSPNYRFIIDDGAHTDLHIIKSLGHLFPKLESGGIYFIEDLHVVNKTELYKLIDKNFKSSLLDDEKLQYINDNIQSCYFTNNDKLCVIIKK